MAGLALVERLVPCDTVSHNAIDLELGRATIHTTGLLPDADTIRVLAARAAENPLVAYQDATGDQISENAVGKHLEHVYEALGVGNQTAAAALWMSARTVSGKLTTVYPSFRMCGGTSRFSARG